MQVVFLILLWGCVEPFSADLPETSSSILVVEGSITDAEGPYTVQLSRSVALSSEQVTAVSGVDMTIEEENGTVEPLTETSQGIYVSTGIQGKVGQRYRLSFTLNGNQYVSSWVNLRRSPPLTAFIGDR